MLLHERAWEILKPLFDRTRQEKTELIQQYHDTERTSIDIAEILPAGFHGKVDTLFIENRTDIWGTYDPVHHLVKTGDSKEQPNVSLTNVLAIRTLLQGGMVYLTEKDEMPLPGSTVNALYRY